MTFEWINDQSVQPIYYYYYWFVFFFSIKLLQSIPWFVASKSIHFYSVCAHLIHIMINLNTCNSISKMTLKLTEFMRLFWRAHLVRMHFLMIVTMVDYRLVKLKYCHYGLWFDLMRCDAMRCNWFVQIQSM